tara:strand:- start:995 stop:1405 length:411 start_codon:yes stop_codon:yes gene_type:complete
MKRDDFLKPLLTTVKNDERPKKNDDLVEAKIFSYKLQVEGAMATMVRNGLLSIRIAYLFYDNAPDQIPLWISKFMFFVGPTVILWALVTYNKNLGIVKHLTKTDDHHHMEISSYIWSGLTGAFAFCCYAAALQVLF